MRATAALSLNVIFPCSTIWAKRVGWRYRLTAKSEISRFYCTHSLPDVPDVILCNFGAIRGAHHTCRVLLNSIRPLSRRKSVQLFTDISF